VEITGQYNIGRRERKRKLQKACMVKEMELPGRMESPCSLNADYKLSKKKLNYMPTGHYPLGNLELYGKTSFK
jgi:hypothetical protein